MRVREIGEAVVMNPRALRHFIRARAVHDDHLPFGEFILKRVVIDFRVVAADHQVMAVTRKLKRAARIAAMIGSRLYFLAADTVREFESFDNNIPGGAYDAEAGSAGYFRSTG